MSSGLIALFDDVVGLAKLAAASIDDVAAHAAKAGVKAAGVVIDDAAVTPQYVVGFSAARELPIVGKIFLGSLRNKLLILLPAALGLSLLAPWAIMPLLMIGGAYLCYEGTEKVFEALVPRRALAHEAEFGSVALDPQALEDDKIASAIKTDFILSAEIMAIALAAIPAASFFFQAATLALVGAGITGIVYGGVAIIVKADDFGVALANKAGSSPVRMLAKAFGRALVRGMPVFLRVLAFVGTAAMIWVGGGIIVHGLEKYGLSAIARTIHHAGKVAADSVSFLRSAAEWLVVAAGSGIVGLAVGAVVIPITRFVLAPAWKQLARIRAAGGRE